MGNGFWELCVREVKIRIEMKWMVGFWPKWSMREKMRGEGFDHVEQRWGRYFVYFWVICTLSTWVWVKAKLLNSPWLSTYDYLGFFEVSDRNATEGKCSWNDMIYPMQPTTKNSKSWKNPWKLHKVANHHHTVPKRAWNHMRLRMRDPHVKSDSLRL